MQSLVKIGLGAGFVIGRVRIEHRVNVADDQVFRQVADAAVL